MKTAIIRFALHLALLLPLTVLATDRDAVLPSAGFTGDRYSTLWTKSPFAIATPEVAAASQDYELVGLAQFEGVSYANLVDKQTQEHFILTTEKPAKNLTLISVQHGANGGLAVIGRNGEQLVLHEDNAPTVPAFLPVNQFAPGIGPGYLPPPNPSVGGVVPSPVFYPPPRVRIHRPIIVIPPPPTNPN